MEIGKHYKGRGEEKWYLLELRHYGDLYQNVFEIFSVRISAPVDCVSNIVSSLSLHEMPSLKDLRNPHRLYSHSTDPQ